MNCDERKDLILLYALGVLDGPEAEELRAHLEEGCPRCIGRLAEANAILSLIPLSLKPQKPSAAAKDRLMRRIAASPVRQTAAPGQGWRLLPTVMGVAAGVLLATALFWTILSSRSQQLSTQSQQLSSLQEQIGRRDQQIQTLQTAVQGAQETIRLIESPAVQVVGLTGTPNQPEAKGRVFLDASRRAVRFHGAGMKPLAASRTYELWLISGDRKVPIGTFNVDERGDAVFSGTIPPDVNTIAAAAVSDEPAGGAPQPHEIQLLGKL